VQKLSPQGARVQASGLHAWYKPISRSEDTVVVIEGKERIMMGSNNYLGLTHHPEVLGAAKAALDRYGSGCTGSRLLNGTLDLHQQLEAELAQFFGKEACLVFSTGYQANLGVVSGLVGRGDFVFLDKLDHASIVDGAKMSYGQTVRFNHGDLGNLERKLQQVPSGTGVMIIVDGVYSMEETSPTCPTCSRSPRGTAPRSPSTTPTPSGCWVPGATAPPRISARATTWT